VVRGPHPYHLVMNLLMRNSFFPAEEEKSVQYLGISVK
jgi:hypothetical protein